MWQVMMIYPAMVHDKVKAHKRKFASGCVYNECILVDSKTTLKEAKERALSLALKTLKEQGTKSPIVGYGVRSTLGSKELHWELLLPELVDRLKRWKKYKSSLQERSA